MIIQPEKPEELIRFLKSKPLILYGMGDLGTRIAKWCKEQGIDYLVSDKNVSKKAFFEEKFVTPQSIVQEYADAQIVVASIVYSREITEDLLRLGVEKERIFQCIHLFMPDEIKWKSLEENGRADFELMAQRIKMIAERGWIPPKVKSVADYGCGHRYIEKYIPANTVYYPIDYIDRGDDTIVCDFNKSEFPNIDSECSICTGVLMYIEPASELVSHICKHTEERIIFSYLTLEGFPGIDARRKSGVIQDFTERQIIDMFAERGFELKDRKDETHGNVCMSFFLFDRRNTNEILL